MKKQLFGAVLGGLLLGHVAKAADALPPWFYERRIHGKSELEPIEKVAGTPLYDRARVVALVEGRGGEGFCSGSRVGPDLFLTNYHCYDYKPCGETQFLLGYEQAQSPERQLIFTCKEVLAKSQAYDYALYRVVFENTVAAAGTSKVYGGGGLSLPIPDGDSAGLAKGIDVDQDGQVTDLSLHVVITHPYVSDLTIALVSPAGTSVLVFDHADGDGRNLDRTFTFADGLAKLKGEAAKGTWKVVVTDTLSGDSGTLDQVDLAVASAAPPAQQGHGLTPADFPVARLWNGPITVGERVMVAQYPGARPKEIDDGEKCKLTTIEPEEVEGRQTIRHMCDTEGGSSGSPVMDLQTGDVVALHWGGTDESNLAIPMSLILKDLKRTLKAGDYAELLISQ